MKRFFLLTAVAAVLFSACQQEDDFRSMSVDTSDITKVIITASLENSKATRTSTVSDGTGVNILWSEDDSLSVLMGGLKKHCLFTIHSILDDGAKAEFIGKDVLIYGGTSDGELDYASNVAIYPYTNEAFITDRTYNSDTKEHSFCMLFPRLQQYAANGSVGNRAFPMVAVSESNAHVGFGFRPVAAGLRIGLKGEAGVKIKSITVQSSKQKISGKAAVTASYTDVPVITIDQNEGYNSIVLDCGEEGVELNPETITQFTVTLPPMSVEEDELTFIIRDTEGGFMEYAYDGAFTFARNTHYNLNKIGTYVSTKESDYILDENGNATINTVAGLKWFAQEVNGGNTFSGKTVTLANSIDLAGEEWTPIGLNGKRFMGTFDGAGNIISHLTITTAENGAQAALFGDVNIATIKNFTIDGAKVLYPEGCNGDFYGAAVVSQAYRVNIEDVNVINSTIQGNNKVAAILAHDADGATMTITNCHVSNCVIETKNDADGGNAAGIVGSIQGGSNAKNLTGCSVKNTIFNVVNSADAGKRSNAQMVATVIATDATVVTLTDCVVEGNTFNQTGVVNYVTPYDGVFVGGARTEVTGKVIVNGVVYPKNPVYIGSTGYPTIQAAIDAVTEENTIITVAEGVYYEILNVKGGKKFTIKPAVDDATVKVAGIDHQTNGVSSASEVIFEGLTIDNTLQEGMDGWYTGTANTMKVCVGIWGGNLTFKDCDFYVSGASKAETGVMSWWTGENLATLTFTGCKFDGANESARAMQIYGKVNLNVEGCTFNTKKDYSLKYVGAEGTEAILTNNTVNNTVNFVELGSSAYAGKNYKVTISNSILGEGISNYIVANPEGQTVIVDDKQVYPELLTPQEALENAAALENATVNVAAGTYTMPTLANGVTLVCEEGTVFDGGASISGSNVTIKNATFTNTTNSVGGEYRALSGSLENVKFEGCNFDSMHGARYLYAKGDVVFTNCTFGNETCVRGLHFDGGDGTVTVNGGTLYGFNVLGASLEKVTFNDCDFKISSGVDFNGMNMYATTYEYNNCRFVPGTYTDCASNNVTATYNECKYTDDSEITSVVRFDQDSATCTITFDGVAYSK